MPKIKNSDILSAGSKIYAKKRKQKKERVESIDFDMSKRTEFLTGFHKRKVERKKLSEHRKKERERQAKIRLRAEAKADRERIIQKQMEEWKAMNTFQNEDDNDEDDDDTTPASPSAKDTQKEEPAAVHEFSSHQAVTTVTVIEDFDVEP